MSTKREMEIVNLASELMIEADQLIKESTTNLTYEDATLELVENYKLNNELTEEEELRLISEMGC